jgi:uncharacterized membrane protein YphA (DoxX/SURF4 family)
VNARRDEGITDHAMNDAPRRRPDPATLLRWICVAVVAGVFAWSGWTKVSAGPDAHAFSMVGRYLDSADAVKALGLAELGLAAWMLSGRMPRLSGGVVMAALAAFTALIAIELTRADPRDCGCVRQVIPGQDESSIRSGLWISIGRNVGLIALAGLSIALSPPASSPRDR